MRNAKVHKIFLTIAVSLLVLVLALIPVTIKTQPAKADTLDRASDYFTGIKNEMLSFECEKKPNTDQKEYKMVARIVEDSISNAEEDKGVLAFENHLIVNNFQMVLEIPATGLNTLTIVFENEAYYSAGNPMARKTVVGDKVQFEQDKDGNYVYTAEKQIINELKYDFSTGKAVFNGEESKAFDFELNNGKLTVNAGVDDYNYLYVRDKNGDPVNAADVVVDGKTVEYRKIKAIADKSITAIKFMFDVDEDIVTAETPLLFGIVSVNQKAGDSDYEQTFEFNDEGALVKKARPIVAISEDFYKKNADGSYSIIKDIMKKYTLTVETFSVLDDVDASSIYVKSTADKVWFDPSTKEPTTFAFLDKGSYTFELIGDEEVVLDDFTVSVVDFSKDNVAPDYVFNEDAYFAFTVALRDAYYDYEKGEHIALGSNLEIPSLKDLVFDDISTYEKLATMVYYATASKAESMSGSYSVDLDEAGNYYFYVVLADENRNEMDKEFIPNEDNANPKYEQFVFTFHMVDDAVIVIAPAKTQGEGYVGIEYTASAFTIEAVAAKTTYKLFYNEDANATVDSDGWKEIQKALSVKDENYYDGYYTYEEIQSIAYDGNLSFTPDRKGAYMIVCTTTSTITSRESSDATIIRVEKDAEEVKVYTEWFKNNVWTVVFLGVGTLCLIGIVALLFVKPKDEIVE